MSFFCVTVKAQGQNAEKRPSYTCMGKRCVARQWRRHGGGASGATCPPPPTSDRTPCEIDARGDFRVRKKMGIGLQDLLRRFTCTDATADVLWAYDYEKEGVVEVVEGVTLVGPR